MNTKTRDPLAVLKDYSAQHGIPDDFDEAIAQVEALVKSARLGADALERMASLVPPGLSMLIADRALFLRDDLKPFTADQN